MKSLLNSIELREGHRKNNRSVRQIPNLPETSILLVACPDCCERNTSISPAELGGRCDVDGDEQISRLDQWRCARTCVPRFREMHDAFFTTNLNMHESHRSCMEERKESQQQMVS